MAFFEQNEEEKVDNSLWVEFKAQRLSEVGR